jgi:hypothetical protein
MLVGATRAEPLREAQLQAPCSETPFWVDTELREERRPRRREEERLASRGLTLAVFSKESSEVNGAVGGEAEVADTAIGIEPGGGPSLVCCDRFDRPNGIAISQCAMDVGSSLVAQEQ